MRVAILGSGSLGSLYAALLSRVEGVELLVHGRGTHGAHMAAEGLHLEGESEHFVSNADVFFSLDEVGLPPVALGTIDYVLLTGKAIIYKVFIELILFSYSILFINFNTTTAT